MSERDELADKLMTLIRGGVAIGAAQGSVYHHMADAILAAGYRKPKEINRERLSIEDGWLVHDTGHCNCAGGDEAASYHHEPQCGLEPLDDLTEVLERSGYRKPRTVTTAAELDALPVGSVVLVKQPEDVRGYSYQQGPSGRWYGAAASIGALSIQLMFPGSTATVLYEGPAS